MRQIVFYFSAPPSYEESLHFTGTIVTEKAKDSKKEKEFKPTYIYYNF
jgi:hypothetical protein